MIPLSKEKPAKVHGCSWQAPTKYSECFSSSIEYTLLPADILSAHNICRKWKLHLCHWFQMLLNKYILHNLHVYNGEMTTHLCTINMCALCQFGDEVLLNQLCYMATGIKHLLISPDGGRWKLRNADWLNASQALWSYTLTWIETTWCSLLYFSSCPTGAWRRSKRIR